MLFFTMSAFPATALSPKPVDPSDQFYAGQKASVFLKFTASDYSLMTGKKMTLGQKLAFKVMKIKLKKELKKNPDLLLSDFYKQNKRMGTGWIILLAVISTLLLLLLLFAIAYGSQK
jgi:hypothetical protein